MYLQGCQSSVSFPFLHIKIRGKKSYFHGSLLVLVLKKSHNTLFVVFSCLFQTHMTPPKLKRCEMNREENKDACSTKNVSLIFFCWVLFVRFCSLMLGNCLHLWCSWCTDNAFTTATRNQLFISETVAETAENLTSTLEPSGFVALRLNAYSWQRVFI